MERITDDLMKCVKRQVFNEIWLGIRKIRQGFIPRNLLIVDCSPNLKQFLQ